LDIDLMRSHVAEQAKHGFQVVLEDPECLPLITGEVTDHLGVNVAPSTVGNLQSQSPKLAPDGRQARNGTSEKSRLVFAPLVSAVD